MKFSAKTTDTGHIESLTRVVVTVSKLAKQCALRIGVDRLSFVRQSSLRSDGNKLYCEIIATSYFEEFRVEGWSSAENEIYLEIVPDDLYQALRSAVHASLVKIKLTKKGNAPYLTVEVKLSSPTSTTRTVTHDVPISVILPRLWSEFAEPELPNFNLSLYLPPVKTVQRIVNAMKSMASYLTISANRKGGDMTFHIRTDPTEMTTYFKDLVYAQWGDESTQGSQRSQLSGRSVAERNDNEGRRDGDNNDEKLYSARVEMKTLAHFLQSQQNAHYRLIMSVVDHRMLHFCAITDDVRFQYFMPSVDE